MRYGKVFAVDDVVALLQVAVSLLLGVRLYVHCQVVEVPQSDQLTGACLHVCEGANNDCAMNFFCVCSYVLHVLCAGLSALLPRWLLAGRWLAWGRAAGSCSG